MGSAGSVGPGLVARFCVCLMRLWVGMVVRDAYVRFVSVSLCVPCVPAPPGVFLPGRLTESSAGCQHAFRFCRFGNQLSFAYVDLVGERHSRELQGFMETGYSITEYETIPFPGHCTVSGIGESKPTIHQRSTFTITAKDANDTQLEGGGDAFFVHIRGADRARARVADNHDGTYTVAWKPTISGKYKICVSLFGEALKGSPFEVTVDGPVPHPSRCEVRGEALFRTTARLPSTFEISFRDGAGNTAHAVELDVYVVPVPDGLSSPVQHSAWDVATQASDMRFLSKNKATRDDSGAGKGGSAGNAAIKGGKVTKGAGSPKGGSSSGSRPGSPTGEDAQAATAPKTTAKGGGKDAAASTRKPIAKGSPRSPMEEAEEEVEEAAEELISLKDGVSRRRRAFPIQIGRHPLRARRQSEPGSDPLGVQLEPEQLATVLEEHISSDGLTVYACVMFEEVNLASPDSPRSSATAVMQMLPDNKRTTEPPRDEGDSPFVQPEKLHSPFNSPLRPHPSLRFSLDLGSSLNLLTSRPASPAPGSGRHSGQLGSPGRSKPPTVHVGWITIKAQGKKLVSVRPSLPRSLAVLLPAAWLCISTDTLLTPHSAPPPHLLASVTASRACECATCCR